MSAFRAWARRAAGAAALLALLPPVAPAANTGGKPGDLFDFGASARALGLGGAYTAVAQDAASLYYNPAGFGALPSMQFTMMHARLFGETSFDYLGFGRPLKRQPGAWGLQLVREATAGVEGRDAMNRPTGAVTYSQLGMGLGGGWQGVGIPELSVGAGFKALQRKLDTSSDMLMGIDVGLQYRPFSRKWAAGLVVKNLGGFSSGDTADKLPMTVRAGATYLVMDTLRVAADVSQDGSFHVGTEYVLGMFSLRGGFEEAGLSLGGGALLWKSLSVDLAVQNHELLGMSERVSLGWRFGAARPAQQTVVSRDYLADARQKLGEREYVEAARLFRRALSINPALEKEWGERITRLESLSRDLGLESRPDLQVALKGDNEQQTLGGQSVAAFLEGQPAKAVLLAHAALGTDTRSPVFDSLLRTMAKLTGLSIQREDILAPKALVREKLKRAQGYFYDRRFDLAERECREALLLDPENHLAWVRLGSALFALGDMAESRKAYQKALDIRPDDASVQEFMRMQGWR